MMRRSRIRHLVPIKAPTRPLDLATADELGITPEVYRQRLLSTALRLLFVPGPGDTIVRREPIDGATVASYHEAIKMLRRLLRDAPDDARAWTLLGVAYEGINESRESGLAFRRAYMLDPESPDAAHGVFRAAMDSGEHELALEAARVTASAVSDDVAPLFAVAHAEIMCGRLDDAERTIESITARSPVDRRRRALAIIVAKYRDGSLPMPSDYAMLGEHLIRELVAMADRDDETDAESDDATAAMP